MNHIWVVERRRIGNGKTWDMIEVASSHKRAVSKKNRAAWGQDVRDFRVVKYVPVIKKAGAR